MKRDVSDTHNLTQNTTLINIQGTSVFLLFPRDYRVRLSGPWQPTTC